EDRGDRRRAHLLFGARDPDVAGRGRLCRRRGDASGADQPVRPVRQAQPEDFAGDPASLAGIEEPGQVPGLFCYLSPRPLTSESISLMIAGFPAITSTNVITAHKSIVNTADSYLTPGAAPAGSA